MQQDALISEHSEGLAGSPTAFEESLSDIGPRIAVAEVEPEIDGGAYPAKAVVGDIFRVAANVLTDGHEQLAVALRYLPPGESDWRETPMSALGNDRWQGHITLEARGTYKYGIVAWRDPLATWLADVTAKRDAGQPLDVEFEIAAALLKHAANETPAAHRVAWKRLLREFDAAARRIELMQAPSTQELFRLAGPRPFATTYDKKSRRPGRAQAPPRSAPGTS